MKNAKKEIQAMITRIELAKGSIREFYNIAKDDEKYGSDEAIDAQNQCFEVLLEFFGWDMEEDEAALKYIPNATDVEIAEWLWDNVLIDFILHEEARKLMELLDGVFKIGQCSLDEYVMAIRESGDLVQPWEENAFRYLLMQWDEPTIENNL